MHQNLTVDQKQAVLWTLHFGRKTVRYTEV
jgi:hypothetical protein